MAIALTTQYATNPKTIPIDFETIQDLKDHSFLQVGDVVRTIGYTTPSDRGGNYYEIVSSGTGVDDGGSFIDLTSSGLQAKGLFKDGVNIRQFGAVGNGVDDDTLKIQAAIDFAKNSSEEVFIPSGKYIFTSLIDITTPIRGEGFYTRTRAAFGNSAWSDVSNFSGSVLICTETSGNVVQIGDGSTSPWYYGLGLQDILIVGPGSGTSTGLFFTEVISSTSKNVGIANFSVGLDWDFVEDSSFHDFKIYGNSTGFRSVVSGNNQNCFYNIELNRNDTSIYVTAGQGNAFYGGLVQSTQVDGVVLEPQASLFIRTWSFYDIWFEKESTMSGDIIRFGPDRLELIKFDSCRFVEVGPINLSGGVDNRRHIFSNLIFIGTKNITIPVGMAGVRLNNISNAVLLDNSKSSVFDSLSGQFTATLQGVSETVTNDVEYSVSGRSVTLNIPSTKGTSNTTSCSLTGMPTNLHPLNTTEWSPIRITNSGTTSFGLCRITSSGVIEFLSSASGSSFSSSGEKGVDGSSVTFSKDV